MAFDGAGNLWVTQYQDAVTEYSPSGTLINTIPQRTKDIFHPFGIALDGMGNIWVSNNGQYVTVYDPESNLLKKFVPPGNNSSHG